VYASQPSSFVSPFVPPTAQTYTALLVKQHPPSTLGNFVYMIEVTYVYDVYPVAIRLIGLNGVLSLPRQFDNSTLVGCASDF
jgi:hypothetical protein